jgi:hypothetical protein
MRSLSPLHRMFIAVALLGANAYLLASSCDDDAMTPRREGFRARLDSDVSKIHLLSDVHFDPIERLWSAEDRALADGGDDGWVGRGMDFSQLPHSWDCLSDPSEDLDAERHGMEIFAWRLFIAANWPDDTGARPRWAAWLTPEELLLKLDGGVPPQERDQPFDGWSCNEKCLQLTLAGNVFAPSNSNKPVYDQRGRRVRYEERLDPYSFYTVFFYRFASEPLADAAVRSARIDLPQGQCNEDSNSHGAIAVKLAWKDLSQEEDEGGRYLSRSTRGPDGGAITLGLVGFHIMQKPIDYQEWVWSTFEHVDNFIPPPGSAVASFHDPACHDCVDNETRRYDAGPAQCRTQIVPTPTELEAAELVSVNARFRAWAQRQGSVLQHYRLIGVQYTPHAYRDGGDFGPPTPAVLRNSIIETYLDGKGHACGPCDECDAGVPEAGDGAPFLSSRCMNCHSFAGNGNKWPEGEFDFRSYNDFTFVPELHLCNPQGNHGHWLGKRRCERLAGKPDGG